MLFPCVWSKSFLILAPMIKKEHDPMGQAMYHYFHYNEKPGIVWLDTLRKHFPINVWLNPTPKPYWEIASTHIVRQVFSDMYPLSVEGLQQAIESLGKKSRLKA